MSFVNLYGSSEHTTALSHFAALVNMASVNSGISEDELALLKRYANRLNVNEADFNTIIKDPTAYPIAPVNSAEERLEYMHRLFRMVFADHHLDEKEKQLLLKYAVGLGYSTVQAEELIDRSIEIFSGISFDDYAYLIHRKKN